MLRKKYSAVFFFMAVVCSIPNDSDPLLPPRFGVRVNIAVDEHSSEFGSEPFFSLQNCNGLHKLGTFLGLDEIKTHRSAVFFATQSQSLMGLLTYFQGIAPQPNRPDSLNPKLVKEICECADYFLDSEPLRRLSLAFPHYLGDAFFWMHLAREPTLYETARADELLRTRRVPLTGSPQGYLYNAERVFQETKISDPRSILQTENYRLLAQDQKDQKRFFLCQSTSRVKCNWLQSDPSNSFGLLRIKQQMPLIREILQIPNVCIAGGYPLALIHPVFFLVDVKSLGTQHHPCAVMQYEGKAYSMIGIPPHDIDVFLCDAKEQQVAYTLERILKVVDAFNRENKCHCKVESTDHCITITGANTRKRVYRLQIIKRRYENIREILLGFDLDASACAMTWANNQFEFRVLPRFMTALWFRVNTVNPFRQSASFNSRLHKYMGKGIFPYLAGASHLSAKAQSWSLLHEQEKKKPGFHRWPPELCHTISGLLCRVNALSRMRSSLFHFVQINDYHPYSEPFLPWVVHHQEHKGWLDDLSPYGTISWTDDLRSKIIFIKRYNHVRTWRVVDPGTQISGTFHPTKYDYYSFPSPVQPKKTKSKRQPPRKHNERKSESQSCLIS